MMRCLFSDVPDEMMQKCCSFFLMESATHAGPIAEQLHALRVKIVTCFLILKSP